MEYSGILTFRVLMNTSFGEGEFIGNIEVLQRI